MQKRYDKSDALSIITAATLPAPSFATSARIDTSFVDGVGGFDVVSYATGMPLRGDPKLTADYEGATASGDPEVWTMVDGKLYFNRSKPVQNLWQQDILGNITSAKANWPKVLE